MLFGDAFEIARTYDMIGFALLGAPAQDFTKHRKHIISAIDPNNIILTALQDRAVRL